MKLKLTVAALAAMLTVPAMAGTPVVTETPVTPTPAPEPIAFEVGAFYSFPTKDIVSWPEYGHSGKKVHMLGGDITSVYKIDDSSSATVRLGYGTGSASKNYLFGGRERYRLHTFTLMPGYRYSVKVDDAVTCYAGVSAGVTNSSLKYKNNFYFDNTGKGLYKSHGSQWGFGYAVEVGVSYAISQDVSVFLAYEFSGNSARPKVAKDYWIQNEGDGWKRGISSNQQVYHTIRAGVSCQF